jgi:choline dehydrogenase-like flavoprotein
MSLLSKTLGFPIPPLRSAASRLWLGLSLRNQRTLATDVCVIGAGPAGLTVARELARSGVRVVVLESGSERPEPAGQELAGGEVAAGTYPPLESSRARAIGGTAHLWNTRMGASRMAKYVPLDAIDFESRARNPYGGWPFPRETLVPWYLRAQDVCGLGAFAYGADAWIPPDVPRLPLLPTEFATGIYQLGRADIFTSEIPDELRRMGNVLLCPRSTVVELETAAEGTRIERVRVATESDWPVWVTARAFVLAAGAIENARLLLLSRGSASFAPGNGSDFVGRCFMEHPRDDSCTLIPARGGVFDDLPFYDVQSLGPFAIRGRFGLDERVLRAGRFPNFSVTLRRRPHGRSVPTHFALEFNLEQGPDPANRVVLARTFDRFGQARAELQWRWRSHDRHTWLRARAYFVRAVNASGAGQIVVSRMPRLDPAAHHHIGTTRMSVDPKHGVVDPDGRVHGVANLYVAGSSVFPTGGFANPTLTIVALALRLADHLAAVLSRRTVVDARPAAPERMLVADAAAAAPAMTAGIEEATATGREDLPPGAAAAAT